MTVDEILTTMDLAHHNHSENQYPFSIVELAKGLGAQ
jgi:hypothetical protein